MSFIDKIMGRESREESTETSDSSEAGLLLQALLAGTSIGKKGALGVPAVAGAVDRIGNVVAMLPIRLYKVNEDQVGGRQVEEIQDDPRLTLLNIDSGDTLDTFQAKKQLTEDYLLDKGGFLFIEGPANKVKTLRYVNPADVSILKNNDPIKRTGSYAIGGKKYKPAQFVVILRATQDGLSGRSLVNDVQKVLSTAAETVAFELGLVKKGGAKKGFLQAEKILDDKAITKLKAAWVKLYSGNDADNVVILNNGTKFQEASANSTELQINERKKTLADDLRDIFHVSEDYDKTVKEAVMPVLNAIESALNRTLLTEEEKESGHYYKFDTREITKGDIKTRYQAYESAVKAGWLSKNEIRAAEDLARIEGLDVVGMGLGDVLFDIKSHSYYVPNTGETQDLSQGKPTTAIRQIRAQSLVAAGIAVRATDTGRLLMLQRAKAEDDPAGGTWEFPGGHIEAGEATYDAAKREWQEEVGQTLPAGQVVSSWTAGNGIYQGFVYQVATEADINIADRDSVTNPDDPDGDQVEAIAWFDAEHLKDNPAIRPELAADIQLVLDAVTKGIES